MILGIDYASTDGACIEPAQTGARFAYVRASGGLATDPTWPRDRARWAAAGVPAGAYHWFNFHIDPRAQARTFIAAAGDRRPGELPPALDLEADSAASLRMTPEACLAAAEECITELQRRYGCVMVYTSSRVWADVFGNRPSSVMSTCPLWLKVPYAWNARNPPHLDSAPAVYSIPGPWRAPISAPVTVLQFQGDSIGLPGTTGTIDLNEFVPADGRSLWCDGLLHAASAADVRAYQAAHGLGVDGIVGPRTFAVLTRS